MDDSIASSVKRRRLGLNASKTSQYAKRNCRYRRKKRILHLHDEILCLIFNKLSYEEICKTIIPVCNRFKMNGLNILNTTFCNIETRINRIRASVLENNNRSNTQSDTVLVYRMLNILDFLWDQYRMLRASIWRFSYFKPILNESTLANRAGVILDQFDIVFNMITNVSDVETLMRYIPNEIRKIKDICKDYIERFERHISVIGKNVPYVAGCKFIDLLDCFIGIDRKIIQENYTENGCYLKMIYTVDRSWFTVLTLDDIYECNINVSREIRFMYKRIARLVRVNNASVIGESLLLQSTYNPFLNRRMSQFHLYCGYGEISGKFYFYGILREGQNMEDNHSDDDHNNDEDEETQDPADEGVILNDFNRTRTQLTFEIDLHCPLYLAPWFIINKYNTDGGDLHMTSVVRMLEKTPPKIPIPPFFYLDMTITSTAAKENRLPYKYNYRVRQTEKDIRSTVITGKNMEPII